jgi:hypothetical protein
VLVVRDADADEVVRAAAWPAIARLPLDLLDNELDRLSRRCLSLS